MPITLQQVEQNKTKFDIIDRICLEVDSKLGDPVYVEKIAYDDIDNPNWIFEVEGQATQQQLDTVMELYLAAGWGRVYAVDLIDRRRNIIRIEIFKFKEPIIHL